MSRLESGWICGRSLFVIRMECDGVIGNLFRRRVWSAPMALTVSSTGGFRKGLIFGFLSSESDDFGLLARVVEKRSWNFEPR